MTTDVFKATLTFDTKGLKQAASALEGLNTHVKTLGDSLGNLSKIDISFRQVDSDLEKFSKRVKEAGVSIGDLGGLYKNNESQLTRLASIFEDTFSKISDDVDKSLKEAAAALGVNVDTFTKYLHSIAEKNPDTFGFLYKSAVKAKEDIVNKSPIPDLVAEIDRLLALVPQHNKPHIEELARQFEDLKNKVIPDINDLTQAGTPRLAPDIRGGKATEVKEQFEVLRSEILAVSRQAPTMADRFRQAFQSIGQSASTINNTLRSVFGQAKTEAAVAGDQIGQAIKRPLSNEELESSIIRLQSILRRLPDSTAEISIKMQRDFNQINQAFNQIGRDEAKVAGLKDRLVELEVQIKAAADATEQKKLTAEYDKTKTKVGELEEELKKLRTTAETGIQALEQTLSGDAFKESLVANFNAIRVAADNTGITMQDRFRGLDLLFHQTGGRLLGLREAIAGTSTSTNILVRQLDKWIAKGDTLDQLNGKLEAQIFAFGNQIDVTTRSLNRQADELKRIVRSEGFGTDTVEEFDKQLTRVDAAFRQVITTARSGGDVGRALRGAKTEAAGLQQEYDHLIKDGIIQADSASAKMLRDMISQSKISEQRLQSMASRYSIIQKEIKKTEQKQAELNQTEKEQGDTLNNQTNIFKRLIASFGGFSVKIGGFFNVFKQGKTDITNVNNTLERTQDEVKKLDTVTKAVRGTILGVFGGGALASIWYRFDDVLRDIGRDFLHLNDLIQNTKITIKGMLTGSEVDSEKAIAGFTKFVEGVVAKTPFEFEDAISTALQLAQQSFDPQIWLKAAANASAAMGKPMEQFVGALVKLQAGATGGAIDQLRDFGLNVNQISGYFDKATGAIVQNVDATKAAAGAYDVMSFEFNKSGQLITPTGDALKILNAYLTQNATFAQAAGARSQSLSGVVSNLKDAFSKLLISVGQPIFDKLTSSATGLLGAVDALTPTLTVLAENLGIIIGNVIDFITRLFTDFDGLLADMGGSFANFVGLVVDLAQGAWSDAWDHVVLIAGNALDSMIGLLSNIVDSAYDWGVSFIGQLADGVLDAAESLLDAVASIAQSIYDMLAPGSPPKMGPLSTIDTWGKGLVETFSEGFGDTSNLMQDTLLAGFSSDNLGFLNELLDPIAARFKSFADREEGLIPFKAMKEQFAELTKGLFETGNIDTGKFEAIATKLREIASGGQETKETEQMIENLEAQLELKKAQIKLDNIEKQVEQEKLKVQEKQEASKERIKALQDSLIPKNKKILDIERQILEAEKAGYVPAELKRQLDYAQRDVALTQDEIKLEEEKAQAASDAGNEQIQALEAQFQTQREAAQAEVAAAQERIKRNEELLKFYDLDQKVFEEKQKGMAQSRNAALAQGVRAARDAARRETETFQQAYARQLDALQYKVDQGVISEEDYLKDLLRLEEGYVDDALKSGVVSGLDEHVAKIKEVKDRLNELLGAGGGAGGGIAENLRQAFQPDSIIDIFQRFADTAPEVLGEVAADAGESFVVALQQKTTSGIATLPEKIKSGLANLKDTIVKAFTDIFEKVREFVEGVPPEWIFPLSLLAGALASPVIDSIFAFFNRILVFVPRIIGAFSGLGPVLSSIVKVLLKFSVVGFIIYGIILNWDEVVEFSTEIFNRLSNTFGTLINNITTIIKTISQMRVGQSIVNNFAYAFSILGLVITQVAGVAKKAIKAWFLVIVAFIDLLGEFINMIIESFGGAEAFAESLGNALNELSNLFRQVVGKISDAFDALFAGDIDGFINRLASIPAVIQASLSTGLIADFLDKLKTAFIDATTEIYNRLYNMLPPSVQQWVEDTVAKVTELKTTFSNVIDEIVALAPQIGEAILRAFSGDFGGFAEIDFSGLTTALQPIGDALKPIITKAIQDGLALAISGFNLAGALGVGAFELLPPGVQEGLINFAMMVGEVFMQAAAFITQIGVAIAYVGDILMSLLGPSIAEIVAQFDGFFEQGRLGGEILALFGENANALSIIGQGLIIILEVLGGVLAFVATVVISALQTFADILPFLEGALAGIVRAINGVIQVMLGVAQIFQAAWFAILGDTDKASELFQQGLTGLGNGIASIVAGISLTVLNAAQAILVGMVSFLGNMIANFLSFFGESGQEWANWIWQIVDSVKGGGIAIVEAVTNWVYEVLDWFRQLFDESVGHSIFPDLVAGIISIFTSFGPEALSLLGGIVNSIIDLFTTIPQRLGEVLGNLAQTVFGSLFGGDQSAEGGAGTFSLINTEQQTLLLQQFQQTATLIFQTIQFAWNNTILMMTLAFQTFITTITDLLTTFHNTWVQLELIRMINWQTSMTQMTTMLEEFMVATTESWTELLTMMTESWTEFNEFFIETWTASMDVLTTAITTFHTTVMEILENIIQSFVRMEEVAVKAGTEMESALSAAAGAADEFLDVLEDLEKQLRSVEQAAMAAAQQMAEFRRQTGRGAPGGGGGGGGYQEGTMRVPATGTYTLHAGETVLPPTVANTFRSFMEAVGRHGVGGNVPGIAGLNFSALGANAGAATEATGVGTTVGGINFYTTIADQIDQLTFERRVTDVIKRNLT